MRSPRPPLWPSLDAAQAEAYRAFRERQIVPFERLAAVAAAVSVVLFIWWDLQVYEDALPETLYIRLGLVALLLGLLAITFTPLGRRHTLTQVISTVILVGGFSWVLQRAGPSGSRPSRAGRPRTTARRAR